jgi:hypothetical protein
MLHGQTAVTTELTLRASNAYADIFNQVDVDVVFVAPDGKEWQVPAFWSGGNRFRVRFAAPEPGRYTYRTFCSYTRDPGLHGQEGELEISPYTGPCTLYQRWMGDTWWMGLTKRLDWPHGFRQLVADRVSKGFNLIQVVVGPLPDFDVEFAAWHPQQANEAGWPWEQDWERINPGFFDLADLRVVHLVESGLVPCIVGMWGYYLSYMGIDRVKRHWRYLVARYAAFPVIWCLAGEFTMHTFDGSPRKDESMQAARNRQEVGWSEVGHYVRDLDPFHNLITAHPAGPEPSEMLRDEAVLDLEMLQTGHSGYRALPQTVERVLAGIAKHPRMPVVNSEVCYEGIMGGSWQDIQRFVFWTSLTSGSAGHTYGAQGVWGMSSSDEPFCGATGNWGDGFWQDRMHLPGSTQVGLGRRLFERYPWWLFEPRQEPEVAAAGRASAFTTGIPGTVAVFYLAADHMAQEFYGVQGLRIQVEPGPEYLASFFNPRTGETVTHYQAKGMKMIELGAVEPNEDGFWPTPPKPTREDWVLVLENKDALDGLRGLSRPGT